MGSTVYQRAPPAIRCGSLDEPPGLVLPAPAGPRRGGAEMLGDGAAGAAQPTPVWANGQGWLVSWHRARRSPDGTPHGAEGVCLTAAGEVVLVSQDGERWSLPAGRP